MTLTLWDPQEFYEALPRLRARVTPAGPESDLAFLESHHPRRVRITREGPQWRLSIAVPSEGISLNWDGATRELVIFQAAAWVRRKMKVETSGANIANDPKDLAQRIVLAAAEGQTELAQKLTEEYIRGNLGA